MSDIFPKGTKVEFIKDIYERADDYSPAGYWARIGDKGEVVGEGSHFTYTIKTKNGNKFGVDASEIKPEE